jgi:hypothetical protein
VVYTRKVGDRTINLAVSGMLWNRSLIMIDEETKSLWSHLLGEALKGPLKGSELEALPAEMVTWEAWKREHPQTTVLNISRTSRNYVKDFYRNPSRFVFAWVKDAQPYAAGFDMLLKNPVLNLKLEKSPVVVTFDKESTAAHLFSSEVDDRSLMFVADKQGRMHDMQTGTTWNSNTGVAVEGKLKGKTLKQLVGIVSYANTWKKFHPNSKTVGPSE